MYICVCNAITDKQIRKAARSGVDNLWGLQSQLGVAVNCGACEDHALSIIREESASGARAGARRHFEPVVYTPSPA